MVSIYKRSNSQTATFHACGSKRTATWSSVVQSMWLSRIYRIIVVVSLLVLPSIVQASATCEVRWIQEQDCELVDHWILEMDGVEIQTLSGDPCGGTNMNTHWVEGVGLHQFTIRAVAADGTQSNPSNSIGATLPLARPALQMMDCSSVP